MIFRLGSVMYHMKALTVVVPTTLENFKKNQYREKSIRNYMIHGRSVQEKMKDEKGKTIKVEHSKKPQGLKNKIKSFSYHKKSGSLSNILIVLHNFWEKIRLFPSPPPPLHTTFNILV